MKTKQLKVIITFKPSEKWLYDEVVKHTVVSGWVKDILIEYLNSKNEK